MFPGGIRSKEKNNPLRPSQKNRTGLEIGTGFSEWEKAICHPGLEGQLGSRAKPRRIGEAPGIIFEAANEKVQVNVAGLFTTAFKLADNGSVIPFLQDKVSNFNWIESIWPREGENRPDFQFSTSGFSIDWESRYATVLKYLEQVNRLTSREEVITMDELKSHWRRRLVLPLKLANNLRPEEYAILVEEIAPESPIQVQAEAIRHYPENLSHLTYWGMSAVDMRLTPSSIRG